MEANPGSVLDLKTLKNVLSSVESKWYDIGVQLNIQPSKLKTFEVDYRNCGRVFSESLLFWLGGNTSVPVSWNSIINALNSPSVDERGLALQIQATYCQLTGSECNPAKETTGKNTLPEGQDLDKIEADLHPITAQDKTISNNVEPSSPIPEAASSVPPTPDRDITSDGPNKPGNHSPHHPNPSETTEDMACREISESSFPLLDEVTSLSQREKRLLEARLRLETREIIKKFWDLFNTFRKSLQDRNFPLQELISYLDVLEAYDPVKEVPPEQQESLLEEHMRQLKNAKSINDVLDVVKKYCSFFNYDIIKCMIEKYGTVGDKLLLQKYIEDFNEYAKRRIYECPSKLIKSIESEKGSTLQLKLDSKYNERNLKALEDFQISLCKVLGVSVNALLLCSLNAGCIELTYRISTFIQRNIFPLSSKQEAALLDLGVLSLSPGDYYFPISDHQRTTKLGRYTSEEFILPETISFSFSSVTGNGIILSEDRLAARRKVFVYYYPKLAGIYIDTPLSGTFEFEAEVTAISSDVDGSLAIGVARSPKRSYSHFDIPFKVNRLRYMCIWEGDLIRNDFKDLRGRNLSMCIWEGDSVFNDLKDRIFKHKYGSMSLDDIQQRDRVGMRITPEGELSFFFNGQNQGVAATNLYQEENDIYPVLNVRGRCLAVRITRAVMLTDNKNQNQPTKNPVSSPATIQFHFHPTLTKDTATILEDGLYARRFDPTFYTRAVAYGNIPIRGRATFEVLIAEEDTNSFSSQSWFKIGVNSVLANTELLTQHSAKFLLDFDYVSYNAQKSDRFGFRISSSGDLRFFFNGKNQGLAVRGAVYNLKYDVYPYVVMEYSCIGVRITRAEIQSDVLCLQEVCMEKIASCLDWSSENVNALPLPPTMKKALEHYIDVL